MPLDLVFRDLRAHAPEPGDLLLRPADADQRDRRDLASFVLARGLGGLERGEGPVRRLVVSLHPTLDDLLATAFARRLAEGGSLPEGARGFARYAALQREGLHPGEVPLTESIEGICLAQLNAHGKDLADPAVGGRLAEDWRRTGAVLMDAADEGKDAFKTPLFGGPDFARERAFLAKDREVYRQDVLRGERWVVRLPGGPPKASALLLRDPKSLLAKQWARSDPEAPVGGAYLFLAVRWGRADWVFSTDPVQRLPIQPLAGLLQEAEVRADPARATAEPWFDGKPFGHTLVAAPRGGTRLSEEEVLRIVRGWTNARRAPTKSRRRLAVVGAAVGGAALAALLLVAFLPRSRTPFAAVDFTNRGDPLPKEATTRLRANAGEMRGFALLVSAGNAMRRRLLPAAAPDVSRVYGLLRDRFGFAPRDMIVLADDPAAMKDRAGAPIPVRPERPDRVAVSNALEEIGEWVAALEPADRKKSQFVFYYAGHGVETEPGEKVGYLVLSGYTDAKDAPRDLKGYDMGHLASDFRRKIDTWHQILLIDCCYSGFTVVTRGDPSEDPTQVYELWDNRAQAVITAGREDQVVFERNDEQSWFNAVLMEALGGEAGEKAMQADGYVSGKGRSRDAEDGIVTDAELGLYLREQVPALRKRAHKSEDQTPLYFRGLEGDGVGQFLFIPR